MTLEQSLGGFGKTLDDIQAKDKRMRLGQMNAHSFLDLGNQIAKLQKHYQTIKKQNSSLFTFSNLYNTNDENVQTSLNQILTDNDHDDQTCNDSSSKKIYTDNNNDGIDSDSKQTTPQTPQATKKALQLFESQFSTPKMTGMRKIGRWYMGIEETTEKQGYSWIRKGYDIKNGKQVRLKFVAKNDNNCNPDNRDKELQQRLKCIKQIGRFSLPWKMSRILWIGFYKNLQNDYCLIYLLPKDLIKYILSFNGFFYHSNVVKLYYYNINTYYLPEHHTTGKEKAVDAVLLVSEPTVQEFFHIFYNLAALDEILARTYFHQIICGLEACHNVGVVHGNLRPSSLFLDKHYNIKIGNFALQNVCKSQYICSIVLFSFV